jgi:hypothetical protein
MEFLSELRKAKNCSVVMAAMHPTSPSKQRTHRIGKFAIIVAPPYVARMLQRTPPAGFIAPCLPSKIDKLPLGP